MKKSKFVFLGLHGGDGENGKIQKLLTDNSIKFNGSDEKTSRLCMDKFVTGELIGQMGITRILPIPHKVIMLKDMRPEKLGAIWQELKRELSSKTLIIKPKDDGCSTGVAHLYGEADLKNYLKFLQRGDSFIPGGILKHQDGIIEMPSKKIKDILFEKFIETDMVQVRSNKLKYLRRSGWIEVTMGVLEKNGALHVFHPSITLAEGEVLSVEEKFQGGTGVNLTPPPEKIIKRKIAEKARPSAQKLAEKIGIRGYARIDAFLNVSTGALSIIEVNTLPGLTPSTVLYHQALAETPPIFPRELLEKIIKNAGY